MKKLLLVTAASLFVAPAHAISIVSLHGGVMSVVPTTVFLSWGVILASAMALGLVIGVRVARRRARSGAS